MKSIKKVTKNRLLSLFLVLAMVLSMLPAMSMTASAYSGSGTKDDPYIATTYDELRECMQSTPDYDTRYIKLGEDITNSTNVSNNALDLTSPYQTVILDLNGFTLKRAESATDWGVFMLSIGNLTIQDSSSAGTGKVVSEITGATYKNAIYVSSSGNLTIEGGTFESTESAIRTQGGTTVINGGTYRTSYVSALFQSGTVTVNGGSFSGTNGSAISVNSDADVTINGCTASGKMGVNGSGSIWNFIPTTSTVTVDGAVVSRTGDSISGEIIITKNVTTGSGSGTKDDPHIVTAYDDLRELVVNAPSSGTQYIKLGSDIISSDTNNNYSLTLSAFGNQNVVLDLAGYTLKRSANSTDMAFVDIKGGSMTINDSVGTGKVIGDLSRYTGPFLIRVLNDGKLTINGGQYENKGTGDVVRIEAPKGGSVTINGGTFLDPPKSDSYDVYTLFYRSGDLDINGGTFYGFVYNERLDDNNVWITNCTVYGELANNGAGWCIGEYDWSYYMPEAAVITVNGEVPTDWGYYAGQPVKVTTPVGVNGNPYIVTDYDELLELMKSTPYNTTRYIKLGSDISYSESINGHALGLTDDAQSVDLDLNGYTVSRSGLTTDPGVVDLRIGSLTIRDSSSAGTGKMTSSVSGGSGQATIYVSSGGKLTIENGTFEVTNGTYPEAIWTQGGTTQINGGTFISTKAGGSAATFELGNVTVDGGTFITNDGDPNAGFGIYVGSNANVILHSCTAIGGPRGIIAISGTKIPEGYFLYYTTIDGRDAAIVTMNDGTKEHPYFVSSISALRKRIKEVPADGTPVYFALVADDSGYHGNYYNSITINDGQNIILDLRGHEFGDCLSGTSLINVAGGTLTINDSVGGGSLVIPDIAFWTDTDTRDVLSVNGGTLIINGGSFQNRKTGRCLKVYSGEAILNGGEFLFTLNPAKNTYNVECGAGSMTINYAHIYDSLYNAREANSFTVNGLLLQNFGEPGVIKQSTKSSGVGSVYLEDHINPTASVTVDGETVTDLHVSSLKGYTIEITPATKISSVKITDVTAPVIGETVNFTATATATGAEMRNVRWFDWDENRYLSEGDVFKEGHAYMIVVTMNAREGYAFNTTNSTMTVTVNGNKGFMSRATPQSVDCSYNFDAAYPAPVITTQPAYNLNINEGEGFSLHVEAENATGYEWHYVNQVGTDYVLEKQILYYREGTQNTDTLVMNYFDYNSRLGHIYCRVYGPGGSTDSDESYINVLPVEYDLWVNGEQVTSENKKSLAYTYNSATGTAATAQYLPYKNELRLWDSVKINYTAGERVEFSDGGYLDNNYSGILYYTPAGATARELKVVVYGTAEVGGTIGIRALTSAEATGTGSIRVIGGHDSKAQDSLTFNCSYPFRDADVTLEDCTVNINGSLTNINTAVYDSDLNISSGSIPLKLTDLYKTVSVFGDSTMTLMGTTQAVQLKDGFYDPYPPNANQILYPAESVVYVGASKDGSDAVQWTDVTAPVWPDYKYVRIEASDLREPFQAVLMKMDEPTVGESPVCPTVQSSSVVERMNDDSITCTLYLKNNLSAPLDMSTYTFKAGTGYRLYVDVDAEDGYCFPAGVYTRLYVSGSYYFPTIVENTGSHLRFYVDFDIAGEAAGVTVSGTATSFLSDTDDVTVQLIESGASEAAYETVVYGNTANYIIDGVASGTYTLRVMKAGHAAREYTITVGSSNVTQNVELYPLGDITWDGRVTGKDVVVLRQYLAETVTLDAQKSANADVNGDGSVTGKDLVMLRQYVAEIITALG